MKRLMRWLKSRRAPINATADMQGPFIGSFPIDAPPPPGAEPGTEAYAQWWMDQASRNWRCRRADGSYWTPS